MMTCDLAQQNIILAQYGELPDELQFSLEQHLTGCDDCRREWNAMLALHEELALDPVPEPSPNFLAASRMRLDEALDAMPAQSMAQRFFVNSFRWVNFVKGAPALATLLLGVGFLGGDVLTRYQVAHAPKLPTPMILQNETQGAIASVSGITQSPTNSELVQVNYNRLVPETMQGSLDDPQIRQLLMLGTKLATSNDVHANSVALLASECAAGHRCDGDGSGDLRNTLLVSLRYDKNPKVRLTALAGLKPYVEQDQSVRDAVLDSLMHDANSDVRQRAVSLLGPVGADSSVRQVLRSVSTEDANPAIRNASFQVLQGVADIQ
ncbi:MAG TPA: HEAT repeat domain-containing protein [Acidobacteriaceae bacterium]|jgi:hypothetical protein